MFFWKYIVAFLAVLAMAVGFSTSFAADKVSDDLSKTDYNNLLKEGFSPEKATEMSGYTPPTKDWAAGTIASSSWTFSAGGFSPSKKTYSDGPKGNMTALLKRISDILLIAISTLAVLLIAVAGFRMAMSAGNSDEAAKGKTMVRYNLLAIVVSLLAYTLIQAVSWIISA